jgi:hypothetical protein
MLCCNKTGSHFCYFKITRLLNRTTLNELHVATSNASTDRILTSTFKWRVPQRINLQLMLHYQATIYNLCDITLLSFRYYPAAIKMFFFFCTRLISQKIPHFTFHVVFERQFQFKINMVNCYATAI